MSVCTDSFGNNHLIDDVSDKLGIDKESARSVLAMYSILTDYSPDDERMVSIILDDTKKERSKKTECIPIT